MHKGFQCLDVSSGRVYVSRDVVFDESIYHFTSLHPNAGSHLRSEILLLPESLRNGDEHTIDLSASDALTTNDVCQAADAPTSPTDSLAKNS